MTTQQLFYDISRKIAEFMCSAREIRLKHGAPVVTTFVVDRSLRPVTESDTIRGGSDAESPTATGGHRLVVCTQQQIKVVI